ncbi:MAG: GNAT family N-acetyltransferase [Candidatus Thalassarchaeaceae archaeon]|nr:GNAT family N-acetyltransferase [Candidatus Thalassarchaeaceae archaeon]|tara:strand:+ start:11862 stop:12311 length:450 start_codon:yes stop_codon:yes gene_type:complete
MDDIKWLREMLRQELDLMAPSLARIAKNNVIIRDEIDRPVAHARLSARLNGHEINAFVIDPAHRGKGISHELLKKCGDGRLFAYTRDAKLQSALLTAGFERARTPGLVALLSVMAARASSVLWMVILLEFRRLRHQLTNFFKYRLFVRE